jgi:hypothetical protein
MKNLQIGKEAGPAVRSGARDSDRVRHLGQILLRFERDMGRRGETSLALEVEAGADEGKAVSGRSLEDGEGRKTSVRNNLVGVLHAPGPRGRGAWQRCEARAHGRTLVEYAKTRPGRPDF